MHALSGPLRMPVLRCLQVRSGLGSIPADFDAVCRKAGVGSGASNRAHWEAYSAAHMFNPMTSNL